jgi:hypothetical protein
MEKIRVSKNLYRGRKIRTAFGVYWLWLRRKSVAYLRDDGTYLVRPAGFFANWDDLGICKNVGRLFRVKKF